MMIISLFILFSISTVLASQSTLVQTTATLSLSRFDPAAASANSKAAFAGGATVTLNPNGAPIDHAQAAVDVFDNTNKQWSVASLSQPRYELAAASASSELFFAVSLYDV